MTEYERLLRRSLFLLCGPETMERLVYCAEKWCVSERWRNIVIQVLEVGMVQYKMHCFEVIQSLICAWGMRSEFAYLTVVQQKREGPCAETSGFH